MLNTALHYNINTSKNYDKFILNSPHMLTHPSEIFIHCLAWDQKFNLDLYNSHLSNDHIYYTEDFINQPIEDISAYNSLENSTFIPFYYFFENNFIHVPYALKHNKSIVRNINSKDIIKFNNMLMRKGMRTKFLNVFIRSLLYKYTQVFTPINFYNNWKQIVISNNYFIINYQNLNKSFYYNSITNTFKQKYINYKTTNFFRHPLDVFLNSLGKFFPIFCFYLFKVRKKIYKNTRGKSGKYTFLWKYIPMYKRMKLVMYWLTKDVQFKSGRTNLSRVSDVIQDLFLNPTNLTAWNVKRFSHNYVYYNSLSSLGVTYRTTKR